MVYPATSINDQQRSQPLLAHHLDLAPQVLLPNDQSGALTGPRRLSLQAAQLPLSSFPRIPMTLY